MRHTGGHQCGLSSLASPWCICAPEGRRVRVGDTLRLRADAERAAKACVAVSSTTLGASGDDRWDRFDEDVSEPRLMFDGHDDPTRRETRV